MYDHKEIEKRWQEQWDKEQLYKAPTNPDSAKKKYILDMFPYPSGAGLHVGHPEGYTATDILSRFSRMSGFEVLHPMGWDAFGLPAENYAIKTGTPPAVSTAKNIETFRRQIKSLGLSYDWSREINTSDPDYYKWTQWLFLLFYKNGLAYKKEAYVNWCPKDRTVLANEQVVNGACERCGTTVVQKLLSQWFFKITDYAEQLLADLDNLDWPEPIKHMQRNWIGKSEGAEIEFPISNFQFSVKVFTTRPDTLFGATYLVLAPDHELVEQITTAEQKDYVARYVAETRKKTELQRTALEKEKTGVFTGAFALNPATQQQIPVWIADYVLSNYGTGAIMAVPAHDERDFDFAKKFKLPIRQVIAPEFGIKRENEIKVKGGCSVVFDPQTQKYAVLKQENGFFRLCSGGVNEGEDEKEGILREVTEESGLHDFALVEKIAMSYTHFHNSLKNSNRTGWASCYLTVLKTSANKGAKLESHEKFGLVWADADEIWKNWEGFNDQKDCDHWFWFFKQAVGRAIVLGYDNTSNANIYREAPYLGEGVLINSKEFTETESSEAREKMSLAFGRPKIQYKLRDWLVSRQRYWGAPIPIIYCEKCGMQPVPEKDLPVTLPDDVDFLPTGESPLARSKSFNDVKCPSCGLPAKRDSDTMDTFVDSSWYFFRFTDPHNQSEFASKEAVENWMPVDTYVGGAEHAVLHLLYARFFTKALKKLGFVNFSEPFRQLRNQGLILGPDGEKMSKSRGNVINPDEVVAQYGADAFRMYEMFMGPLEDAKPWSMQGIIGLSRFLDRVYKLKPQQLPESKDLHKLIRKISFDIALFKYNTAIAAFMEYLNNQKELSLPDLETYLKLLAPFAPHLTEQMWHDLGHVQSIHKEAWPQFDENLVKDEKVDIVIQVNGKTRGTFQAPAGIVKGEEMKKLVDSSEIFTKLDLKNKKILKVVFVPERLINFVVKE